ncbi:hypothetical protein Fmac_006281 [Flemingia macrophylla]|uniref:Uncharacterized protein n=1 Tax=Flemingia macrophylla TaxID=520843 RepID=A0ABD1NA71_9FABA
MSSFPSYTCSRCSIMVEDELMLSEIVHTREIWLRLNNIPTPLFSIAEEFKWFHFLILLPQAPHLVMAAWWIWKWRNNMIFNTPT